MSRLKKVSSRPDPFLGEKVEEMVKLPAEHPNEDKSEAFLIAKQIVSALPLSPSNSVSYLLADAISNGELGEIGDQVDFQALLTSAQDFLKQKGILASKKKL